LPKNRQEQAVDARSRSGAESMRILSNSGGDGASRTPFHIVHSVRDKLEYRDMNGMDAVERGSVPSEGHRWHARSSGLPRSKSEV
jgi:hypothetical protein